ncbi:MAG: DUF5317 domain-containing protein [Desulfosporosinus sp.]|nr:DUF5317 domain-containing protein [Desulfosporosinus sp.]
MTHLSFLADRFYLDILGLKKQMFSVGDILIDIGVFFLVFKTMVSEDKRPKTSVLSKKI